MEYILNLLINGIGQCFGFLQKIDVLGVPLLYFCFGVLAISVVLPILLNLSKSGVNSSVKSIKNNRLK